MILSQVLSGLAVEQGWEIRRECCIFLSACKMYKLYKGGGYAFPKSLLLLGVGFHMAQGLLLAQGWLSVELNKQSRLPTREA